MVATVRNRKKSSSRKSSKKNQISGWQVRIIIMAALIIIALLGVVVWQLQSNKNASRAIAASTQKTTKPQAAKPQSNSNSRYQYTEILENRSIDTGSGVTITRNYEAETIARENARKKALAEKKRKLEEERRKVEAEKARIAEEKRRIAEEKRRLAMEKKMGHSLNSNTVSGNNVSSKPVQKGKLYIECARNYRTEKEAQEQKAKLAFNGKESSIYHKQIGGGYAYAVRIGPYTNQAEAEKARSEIVNAKLGSGCAFFKY